MGFLYFKIKITYSCNKFLFVDIPNQIVEMALKVAEKTVEIQISSHSPCYIAIAAVLISCETAGHSMPSSHFIDSRVIKIVKLLRDHKNQIFT